MDKKLDTAKNKAVQAAINEANLLDEQGLGPYRKVGMHVPKTKLYKKRDNELEIPPECPMHGKTKEEIQLELFGDNNAS